jgi:hypothetical protein
MGFPMSSQFFSRQSIAKVSTISLFAIALILGNTGRATAYPISYDDAVNETADMLFHHLHRDLNGRKIAADEYEYIREWQAIHDVVGQGVLQYEKDNPKNRGCDSPEWYYPSNSDRDVAIDEKLADAVFQSRYPERRGQLIRPQEQSAIREWNKIKKAMFSDICV